MKTVEYGSTTYEVPEWAAQRMFDEICSLVDGYDSDWGGVDRVAINILREVQRRQAYDPS